MKFGEKITNTLIPEWKEFYLNYELLKDALQLSLEKFPFKEEAKKIKGFRVQLSVQHWPLLVIDGIRFVDPNGTEYFFAVDTTTALVGPSENNNAGDPHQSQQPDATAVNFSILGMGQAGGGSVSSNDGKKTAESMDEVIRVITPAQEPSSPLLRSTSINLRRRVSGFVPRQAFGVGSGGGVDGRTSMTSVGSAGNGFVKSNSYDGSRIVGLSSPGVGEGSPSSNGRESSSLAREKSLSQDAGEEGAVIASPDEIYPGISELVQTIQIVNNIFSHALSLEMDKVTQFYRRQTQLVCSAATVCVDAAKRFSQLTSGERASLRVAFRQVYYSLDRLQQFADLNVIAVGKILKKFDKNTQQSTLVTFQEQIDNLPFSAVFAGKPSIQSLKEVMFNSYAEHVMKGSKKDAREALYLKDRADQLRSDQPLLFSLGGLGGIALSLTVLLIQEFFTLDFPIAIPGLHNAPYFLALTFALMLLPILFGFNVMAWEAFGVNYPFVFDLDPTRHFSGIEIIRNNLLYFIVWLICAYATLRSRREELECAGGSHSAIPAWLWPYFIAPVCILIKVIFSLVDDRQAWFLPTTWRILITPAKTVQFSDFWLTDQFTSLAAAFAQFQFFWCYFDAEAVEGVCEDGISMGVFGIAIMPQLWRLLQCFRRYYDMEHKTVHPHLVNAGKYTTGIFSLLSSFFLSMAKHHEATSSVMTAALVIYFTFHIASTCYSGTWDMIMDSGILQVRWVKKSEALEEEIALSPAANGGDEEMQQTADNNSSPDESGGGEENGDTKQQISIEVNTRAAVPGPLPPLVPATREKSKLGVVTSSNAPEQILAEAMRNTNMASVKANGAGGDPQLDATARSEHRASEENPSVGEKNASGLQEAEEGTSCFGVHFSIRKNILYPHMGVYYFFLVANSLMRLYWLAGFILGEYSPGFKPWKFVFVALVNVLRRFLWNFFRVENEQINNYENYRATRFAPVPTRTVELDVETPESVYNRFKQENSVDEAKVDGGARKTSVSSGEGGDKGEAGEEGALEEHKRRGVDLSDWSFLTKYFAHLPEFEKRTILRSLMVDISDGPTLKKIVRFRGSNGEGKSRFFASLPEPVKANLVLTQVGAMTLVQYKSVADAKSSSAFSRISTGDHENSTYSRTAVVKLNGDDQITPSHPEGSPTVLSVLRNPFTLPPAPSNNKTSERGGGVESTNDSVRGSYDELPAMSEQSPSNLPSFSVSAPQ